MREQVVRRPMPCSAVVEDSGGPLKGVAPREGRLSRALRPIEKKGCDCQRKRQLSRAERPAQLGFPTCLVALMVESRVAPFRPSGSGPLYILQHTRKDALSIYLSICLCKSGSLSVYSEKN